MISNLNEALLKDLNKSILVQFIDIIWFTLNVTIVSSKIQIKALGLSSLAMILKFQSDSRISQYCLGRLIFGVSSNQNMGRNIRSRRTQRRPGEHKTPT